MAQYLAEVTVGQFVLKLKRPSENVQIDTVFFRKNRNCFLALGEDDLDFDFLLTSDLKEALSFDRLKNGALCFNTQFLGADREDLGLYYAN